MPPTPVVFQALGLSVLLGLLVGLLSNRRLLRQIAVLYAAPLAGGIALILFWDRLLALL